MKARNTKTGEVVTHFGLAEELGTISYVDSIGTISYVDSKGILRITNTHYDEWEIIEETETDSIRQQAAIAAMQGILSNADGFEFLYKENEKHTIPTGVARLAIACADELIRRLCYE